VRGRVGGEGGVSGPGGEGRVNLKSRWKSGVGGGAANGRRNWETGGRCSVQRGVGG